MTPIITTLYSEIKAILDKVTNIKEKFARASSVFKAYPAVVYSLDSIENAYSTTTENFKVYKFKLFVIIGVEQTTIDNIAGTVMPNTLDAIIQQFDTDWSLNSIDGHRCWVVLNGGAIGVEKSESGLLAVAELELTIKISTNN